MKSYNHLGQLKRRKNTNGPGLPVSGEIIKAPSVRIPSGRYILTEDAKLAYQAA
jgi:hypothetical protein